MEKSDGYCDTIIIGGGISGLSCARKLHDNNKSFLLITKDIGGRILTSEDGNINYGAYYVGNDYTNVLKFVKKGRRLATLGIEFHKQRRSYFLFNYRSLLSLGQFLKLALSVLKFKGHYNKFKKKCSQISQKEALNSDPYLKHLYNQKTSVFVKEHHIEDIVDDLLGEFIYATTFSHLSELYAFEFLHFLIYAFTPVYEFIFLKEKIIKGFEKNIIIDSVISLNRKSSNYELKTENERTYYAKNLVIATPIHVSKKLLNLKEIKKPVSAHMFHLFGSIKEKWNEGEEEVFHQESQTLAIAHQRDGTYLFYTRQPYPDFEKYFTSFKILQKKYWDPAFNLNGSVLLDSKQGKNLYLVGDYNVCGLEDSFITGIYAANQIIKGFNS